jgi:serine/threonine protein kinase
MPLQTKTNVSSAAAARSRRAPLESPRTLGLWELVRLVGEGSWTRVYAARPLGSPADRPAHYAIKVLHERIEQEPEAIGLLCREALVSGSVSHPHLVPVLAAQLADEPRYLVMPWLEGATLAAHIARQRPRLPIALWLVRQAAEALGALHDAGWMHCDVKPDNIFVSPRGHVTLVDLGFARRPLEESSIVDRPVVGTIQYIAPEMISSSLRADIRSDIYSLGVTLFELLSGERPFAGKDLAELADQHRTAAPPDLRRLVPELPCKLVELVGKMLAKEPLRRPQTPQELVQQLVALEIETFTDCL